MAVHATEKNAHTTKSSSDKSEGLDVLTPLNPCRLAVYDDPAATPQIIEIAPQAVDSYMNAITQEIIGVLRGFRSSIPFMVVRECVENLIHASFKNPTVSIMYEGKLVRFSDQGPGISHKEAALEFGTTTATNEMRKYIRGVGSGLPVAHQYMQDRGGSLVIEDNLEKGCVITISLTEERCSHSEKSSSPYSLNHTTSQNQGIQRVRKEKNFSSSSIKTLLHKEMESGNYGEEVKNSSSSFFLEEKEKMALFLCLSREKIGPTDLMQLFGHSLSTWSRTLQYLVGLGLMNKPAHQQKYHLSPMGKEFVTHNI